MKLGDWWIGGLEDLIYLPQRAQRVIWGLNHVERVERVEDWKNHKSPNPPMASAIQKETEERRDKLENMVRTKS